MPPSIAFDEWRQVSRTDEFSEFRETFQSALPSGDLTNDQIELQVFVPASSIGKPPVVILLNYWGATDSELERQTAAELAYRGIASVIVPLPYHLSRTPPGHASGELAITPDPEALKKTMTQSVSDIRRTIDWIKTRTEFDGEQIGITGTSLGAIVSSLAFAVEPRIKSASFLLGGADLAYLMMNSSRTTSQRHILTEAGWTEESLHKVLLEIEPTTYLKPDDARPSYVINAKYDTIVPFESSRILTNALANHTELTLETGHFGGFLVKDRLISSIAKFFDATLRGKKFSAPDKFYSPTVRFSLMLDTETGLQLGAGLDLWRSNDRADIFAAAFITPSGPRAYFGFQLGNGVSIGAMFSRSGTSPGLVWSTIF
ncbi:MAG: alpha/beta hydrolase family protein [Fimbriimonadaceae bacterium]